MSRELSRTELEWLESYPIGMSHNVTTGEFMAGCDECEWTAQAESFEYLMILTTEHLKESYSPPTVEEKVQKATHFYQLFGWDPWAEGLIVDEDEPEIMDMLRVTEIDSGGEVVAESFYRRPLENGEEPVGDWDWDGEEG